MPHIIVGTAGHIDHGKTALVKALTGIDADRLKEEKERGITIDIGFANLSLDADTTIGFIDVPGHERFIKNMLAGVWGIDLVMLVIAADESVMPQTREHLEICKLLHIKRGFTVLTKIDVVEKGMVELAESEIREFLHDSFLERSPIVKISSRTGEGIPEVLDTLREFCKTTPAKDASEIFRLPVDRSFSMKGFGAVVTGTLIAGQIRKEEEVEAFPSGRRARVRGIQVHGAATSTAVAGQRTALNLQGVDVTEIHRGMVLADPGLFSAASMLDCHFELLASAPNPIHGRKRIRFHAGAAEVMGYAVLLGQERLNPGQAAFAQIRLETPVLALPRDRFIVRQYSPMTTIGGGEILDAASAKHRRADGEILQRLKVLKDGSDEDRLMVWIDEAGLSAAALNYLVGRSGLQRRTVSDLLAGLGKSGRVVLLSAISHTAVSARVFADASEKIMAEVRKFHQANPLIKGIGREELKARALGNVSPLVFQALLEKLVLDRKIVVVQDLVHEFGRAITLKGDEQRMRDQLIEQFRHLGLRASSPDELIATLKLDSGLARKIIQFLIKENLLIKVSEDMIIDREAMEALIKEIRDRKAINPKLGVAEFKDLAGVSRKYAIPLLEYLDRQRVTRRVGDDRMIL